MKVPFATLALVALLVPSGLAGTPTQPEISDAADATGHPALDVRAAWITNDATNVYFHIKVSDASSTSPLDDGHTGYIWRFEYTMDGKAYAAQLRNGYIETLPDTYPHSASGVCACVGSGLLGANDAEWDRDAHVLTLSRPRAATPPLPAVPAGTVLTGLTVKTFVNDEPLDGPLVNSALGPTYIQIDGATTTRTYTVV